VAYRSAQDWSARVLGRRAYGSSDEHAFWASFVPAVDAADKESCRPDFAVAIYPGHLWIDDRKFELNPDIRTHITRQTPPTFLLQAEDDHLDNVNQSLVY
jgi:hypothetical protein